jgi:endoglycosylceramidase
LKRFRLGVLFAVLTGVLVWGCTRTPGIDTAAAADDVPAYRGPQIPSHHHQLRRNGAWLVDAQGRAVILHGVNAVWKQAPYVPPDSVDGFTAADADWLAAHGFNAVRLGVLFSGVMPQPHMVDPGYLEHVDRVVQLLAARGIYILIDFHQDLFNERYKGEGFPDWAAPAGRFDSLAHAGFPLNYFTPPTSNAFDRLWDNVGGLQEDYRSAWIAVAGRWSRQEYLMGYELINEPWPGGNWARCSNAGGCTHFERDKLQPMYEKMLAGIRTVDQENLVWLEPQILFDFGADSHLGERGIDDGQLGLSWHDYCLPETLLQAFGLKKLPACQPLEQRVFSNARITSRRLGSASLMTEFGASDDLADTARLVGYADDNMTGWMVWHYKNWGDPTTQAQGSGAQSLFQRDGDFGSVKQPKLEVLERPYPQAVAGTPVSYDFDPQSKAFSLEYNTALPGGGSGAGLETDVYVPALHYPRGYTVRVDGGRVVSEPDAAHLLIVADAGADSVSVSLSPN